MGLGAFASIVRIDIFFSTGLLQGVRIVLEISVCLVIESWFNPVNI